MLNIDVSKARSFLSDEEFNGALEKAKESFELVKSGQGEGAEMLGWRTLLSDPNDAELEKIDSLATQIRADADVFVVCGIGGSYLGARAVIDALSPFFGNDGPEIVYAGHHLSGKYVNQLIDYLEEPNDDGEPKSVYVNVISKSGSTLETALSFRILRSWVHDHYDNPSERIICTTSEEGGVLNPLVDEYGYSKFVIPDGVGGRFSVLTPVGLLPIAVAGIDIKTLFYEAVSKYEEIEKDPSDAIEYAAARYALYKSGKDIEVIASFEPELQYIGHWMQQLLAESEAKDGEGMFPTISTFSTDLHSLGQLIQQGKRNLVETFLIVENAESTKQIEKSDKNIDGLDYLAGKNFHDINSTALEGTIQAHTEGEVPVIKLIMEELNAQHIGEFIYLLEVVTAIYCYCLGVNPFNQPGVEDYKSAMYKLLGK
ncbi:glucose-6-phosphate isomerase [Aliifodinibius sp. S!AR15-10]|uniref:glucose-6-phosphate isomerase n=1 Tax=Aliifodinibius sp. S!AR15-10 TaxID=2950437 RepID=UPI00285B23FE|nr:glucose-6-phosphate isomerase [Aliifodinibius sp. S!AR15-10]MDR8390210.1 glucose-6-phosphate isomerase [Aliifodinibius sp. S!AR15-10]